MKTGSFRNRKFCSGDEDGRWIGYHANGVIQYEGEYDKGMRVGKWKYYYENKKLFEEGSFVKDLQQGTWNYYFESGQLEKTGLWEDGVQEPGPITMKTVKFLKQEPGSIINNQASGLFTTRPVIWNKKEITWMVCKTEPGIIIIQAVKFTKRVIG
ncbi:MAG: hypothetical protein IPO32_20330 [Crocinitomicaceae bacterium]|nr:hypothetical protein [Crocinitomicaceae bacterium]